MAVVFGVVFATGCGDKQTVSAPRMPAASPSPTLRAGQGKPFNAHPDEQELDDIADSLPSFAGYSLDPKTGTLVVLVTDMRDAGQARSLSSGPSSTQRSAARVRGLKGDIVVALASYRFGDLSRWRDSVSMNLLGIKTGVLWVDLDETANRVAVGVDANRTQTVQTFVKSRLVAYGVPQSAVVFEAATLPVNSQYGVTLNDVTRPLLAGTEVYVSAGFTCTMGPLIMLDGVVYASTNAHCATPAGVTGLVMHQPLGAFTGTEFMDPIPYTVTGPGYSWANARWSDAALFSVSGTTAAFGRIARTQGDGSLTIDQGNPFFQITAVEPGGISNGWRVFKMGRTTGWRYGDVTRSCYDVTQQQAPFLNLHCQFKANYANGGGDSGSPVFAPYNGGYMVVGIHWGAECASNCFGIFSGFRGIEFDLVGSFGSGRVFAF